MQRIQDAANRAARTGRSTVARYGRLDQAGVRAMFDDLTSDNLTLPDGVRMAIAFNGSGVMYGGNNLQAALTTALGNYDKGDDYEMTSGALGSDDELLIILQALTTARNRANVEIRFYPPALNDDGTDNADMAGAHHRAGMGSDGGRVRSYRRTRAAPLGRVPRSSQRLRGRQSARSTQLNTIVQNMNLTRRITTVAGVRRQLRRTASARRRTAGPRLRSQTRTLEVLQRTGRVRRTRQTPQGTASGGGNMALRGPGLTSSARRTRQTPQGTASGGGNMALRGPGLPSSEPPPPPERRPPSSRIATAQQQQAREQRSERRSRGTPDYGAGKPKGKGPNRNKGKGPKRDQYNRRRGRFLEYLMPPDAPDAACADMKQLQVWKQPFNGHSPCDQECWAQQDQKEAACCKKHGRRTHNADVPELMPCLSFCLQTEQTQLSEDQVMELLTHMHNTCIPVAKLPDIARMLGVRIVLHTAVFAKRNGEGVPKFKDSSKYFGAKDARPVHLCFAHNHYFQFVRKMSTAHLPAGHGLHQFVTSLRLLDYSVRSGYLLPMRRTDCLLASAHQYRVKPTFEDHVPISDASFVESDGTKSLLQRHAALLPKAMRPNTEDLSEALKLAFAVPHADRDYFVVAFDFETDTNSDTGVHEPYLCSTYGEHRALQRGFDSALHMMKALHVYAEFHGKRKVLMLAHNANYDWAFLGYLLHQPMVQEHGGKLFKGRGCFGNLEVEVHCTWRMIPDKLSNFGELFHLEQEKETINHQAYTAANRAQRWLTESQWHAYYPDIESWAAVVTNCARWKCTKWQGGVLLYDIHEYSKRYCMMDTELCYRGYMCFREQMHTITGMDIDAFYTLPSVGFAYATKEGVFDGVPQLAGVLREFVQDAVVGGRVCVRDNTPHEVSNENIADFDAVGLYNSTMIMFPGFVTGKCRNLTPEELRSHATIVSFNSCFVRVRVTGVRSSYGIPLTSYKDEEGRRIWSNDMVGRVTTMEKTALEDAVNFGGMEYEALCGVCFPGPFNTAINKVSLHLFHERLKMKAAKNPIQNTYKLVGNALYGRTLQKASESVVKFVAVKQFDTTYYRNRYEYVQDFSYFYPPGQSAQDPGAEPYIVRVRERQPTCNHSNYAHAGCAVLGYSKRIMNEVMCLAEDIAPKCVHYTDTDSMHIPERVLPALAAKFEERYGRALVGKGYGQFHTDFKWDGHKDIVSVHAVFCGKKAYVDQLAGRNTATGEWEVAAAPGDFHIRLKSVPTRAIEHYCGEHKLTPVELYQSMLPSTDGVGLTEMEPTGEKVTFNCLAGGGCSFQAGRSDGLWRSKQLVRSVQFNRGGDIDPDGGYHIIAA